MQFARPFHQSIVHELEAFLEQQTRRFPADETLTIDLHCHDYNSNVPDEQLGRMLGVPETWLTSTELMEVLTAHGCTAFTVTNHNNARSCYELIDRGFDVLVGAEFSCMVPDFRVGIHVLAYGFEPAQEKMLNKLRSDIYKFQEYTAEHDIPTIWAHPLYHYKSSGQLPLDFFDKMALLFQRFEVLNGQRDSWQNMMMKVWIESLDRDRIDTLSRKFRILSDQYCRKPYVKSMAGGSDSHMGIFTGLTGTRLHVPGHTAATGVKRSTLALDAIRRCAMAPFGSHNDSEKMAITFLDYFCQIGLNVKDPGLLGILLHKGEPREKLLAFVIANGFAELKRHKTTTMFLKIFHDCFSGRVPGFGKKFIVPRVYKQIFNQATGMARIRRDQPDQALSAIDSAIHRIFADLGHILFDRLGEKFRKLDKEKGYQSMKIDKIVDHFEFPSHLRALFEADDKSDTGNMTSINLSDFLDGLSFPFLASAVIGGAFFTSARVMYKSRPLLTRFSETYNVFKHPERTLWLSDTFEDSNGVALVLKSMLAEVRKRNLPIDFLVASSTLESGDHLIVVPPLSEFTLPFYEQQPVRIPNILEIHRIFKEGEYSRVICSTEGAMGLIALYLKNAYTVPAHFYVHTDWMMFADKVLNFDELNKNRLRRLLRTFYRGFDSLFVLNSDQRKWLIGSSMGFDPSRVMLTAHWADEQFKPAVVDKKRVFGLDDNGPVLLFAGRLSDEKGVMELPAIMQRVRQSFPNARIALAGIGPREKELRKALPDALFLGWVNHTALPDYYSAADMLILPSRFDTFGCVVLEALSCGLPVAAYRTKGPKDIIIHRQNGYLAGSRNEMIAGIIEYLGDAELQNSFRRCALERAKDYDPDVILREFLLGLQPAV